MDLALLISVAHSKPENLIVEGGCKSVLMLAKNVNENVFFNFRFSLAISVAVL